MARNVFISYKYSEARDLRDRIIRKLGIQGHYYQGETSQSPDLIDFTTETIKRKLADMMYKTSVTVVILSPNMKSSKWIDWEIEYSLKNIVRQNRTSHTNGVVCVIMKVHGTYDWFKYYSRMSDGCNNTFYHTQLVHDIINNNRFNQKSKVYSCMTCQSVNEFSGSFISFVEEDVFLANPDLYIENAYDKSENNGLGYDLIKQR